MKHLLRIFQLGLLVLFSAGIFAQNVPEYMYFKFNAPGNQQNYGSAPVGTNPAVLTGLTIGGTGQFGTALQGNGGASSTNRLNTGWATNLPSTGWTISMWLNNMPSNTTLYYLWGDPNASSFRCFLGGAAGAGNLLLRRTGMTDVTVTGVAPGPMVVHFVYTGSAIRVFKNGVFSHQVTQTSQTITGSGPFLIGGYSTSTGMPSGGLMDEFRMYNRALPDNEVLATWNQPLPLGAPTGVLQGNVTNTFNGAPVPNATVTVTGYPPVITNAAGFYQVSNIVPGTVTINASATGYQPYTGTATIVAYQTTIHDFTMTPIPSYLTGTITNGSTGGPVIGARISVGPTFTYSNASGYYNFQAFPTGLQPVIVEKTGFVTSTENVNIIAGGTTTYNKALDVAALPPGPVTATLNGTSTAVDITWLPPSGPYEIIYDDGGKENWTVWAAAGNMNAVKFTPITGSVQVLSGKVNIGDASNYAAGTDPTLLAPFQIAIYDATGPAGMPGTQIGGPVDVVPANFGWNTFTFAPVTVTGNFYLVMIQGGTPPNAAGLAVDETTNNLRSYSRFVTGGGPWLPASGNYMMRCTVTGQGGPLDLDMMVSNDLITANPVEGLIYDHTPATVTGMEGAGIYDPLDAPAVIPYTVWRLLEGQEGNEALWGAPLASSIPGTSYTDNGWPSLPDGAYRWAVKAGYPVNRLSAPTFSNVIGKNWTAEVTVNITLSCGVTPVSGTTVKLQNNQFSQYVYTAITTTSGTVTFPAVWKGNYDLTVSRIGYDPYVQPGISIMGPVTLDVILLQQKIAPTNMFVDDKSLEASWNAPVGLSFLLKEEWASGNFTANNWTAEGNWLVRTTFGNPAPAAEFYWSPSITNYTRSLTSKTLTGTGAPDFKLFYDIYYSDWGGSLEEMAVEYQVGGAGPWILLKHYDNTGGDIPWTTETFDMSSVGAQTFKVRFRAYGVNSFNINNWDFDNIIVRSVAPDPKPCILAYNVYLNNVLDGVTLDTTYMIPPSHVTYGTTYNACVKAVYGSGYSAPSCYTFVSKFLYPPLNLQVEAVECVAYLTWEKPVTYKAQANSPRAINGTMPRPSDGSVAGRAPIDRSAVTQPAGQQNNGPKGSIAFGYEAVGGDFCDFDLDNLPGLTYLNGPATPDFVNGMVYPEGEDNLAYASCYGFSNLYTIDHTTMAWSSVGNIGVSMGELTIDPSDGTLYGTDGTSLYSIDPAVPSSTLIGGLGSVGTMIAIVCDGNGDMWGHDVAFSPPTYFYSVDKATGAATIVGDLGFLALYAQGALYDQATDQVILAAFNGSNLTAEIRAVDVTTGSSTILSSYYYNEISAACLPITGGVGPLKGLIGYKIYRDGVFLDDVMDPDTLFYYDFTVDPGTHEYGVTAYYDLTDYGFPGQFDESMIEGPVEVDIMCGRPLPFYEPWNSGNFTFNDWMLSDPTNTNWSVTPAAGNPEPCADFSWQPIQYTYELSIETPVLNGGPFTCATIWCDFDYKLADRNKTGVEKLMVDVFSKGQWKNKAELANNGDKNWTSMHVDISSVTGKAFKVRFRAMGENSADILHWYVDNVHVYAKCNPPLDLEVAAVEEKNVTLTWTKPECEQQASFNPVWIHWDDGTNYDAIGTGGAVEFDIAARWDASMITAFDGGQVTKIAFFPSSSGSASYKIRVWQGPDAATLLVDEAVASPTLDDWNIVDVASPVPIDISQELWIGVNVNASSGWPAGCDAGPEVDGYGNMIYWSGAWATLTSLNPSLTYNWNVQGYVEPADDHAKFNQGIALVHNTNYKSGGDLSASGVINQNAVQFNPVENGSPMDGREVLGYNVYMSDDNKVTYDKLNTNLVTDTTYNYTIMDYGNFCFYVTAVYPSYGTELCESDSSNVVCMPWFVGLDQQNGGRISIFPNPATENVFVKSDFTITNIEVMNYLGQTVYNRQNVGNKNEKVNVANYPAGIYFVKVTTTEGIRTVKITVAR